MKVSFAAAILLRVRIMPITEATEGSYTNPCEEFGTDLKLNALYGDPPPESCPDGSDSYKCSGVFYRAIADTGCKLDDDGIHVIGHCELQDVGPLPGIPPALFKIPEPLFSIGTTKLMSPVCPAHIIDGGEYPYWCPSPIGILTGSNSFSYVRADTAPPISVFREWEKTGINLYTGTGLKPRVTWPGPGIILLQDDINSNPDVILPEGGENSGFWDNNRISNFWPQDAGTFDRSLCGSGPDFARMLLGIGGPIVPFEDVEELIRCPPDAQGWEQLGLPNGYNRSCPVSALESAETYFEYWKLLNQTAQEKNCSSAEFKELREVSWEKELFCEIILHDMQVMPQQLMCGIPPEYFDEVMIPANKLLTNPETRETIVPEKIENLGLWNEILIKSWGGMGFPTIAAHLVLAHDDTEGSKEFVFEQAKSFFEAAAMNGGPNIRIPVVYFNRTRLFSDPDAEPQDEVFTCADYAVDDKAAAQPAPVTPSSVPSSAPFLGASAVTILYLWETLFFLAVFLITVC